MNIAILGFDTEGRSSYDYFVARGHHVVIHDQKSELADLPSGAETVLGEQYLDDLNRYDLLIRTAGMHPQKILVKNPGVEAKISTHINEFLATCPTKNIIGVTGTKGKGTTSTLITKMLEADGRHVKLGGNIGVPPLSFIDEVTPESWVVLELSSFQLIDVKHSPHVAVCLMVVPEHLDWHNDLQEYYTAKSQLFRWQTANDIAIFNPHYESSTKIVALSPGHKLPYTETPGAHEVDTHIEIDGQFICDFSDIKLLGAHNRQNICAAVTAVWQTTHNVAAVQSVISSFEGLEHRLEFVREIDGVKYFNDSFATGLHASTAAMSAISGPKIILIGGFDRMLPIDAFAEFVAKSDPDIKQVILYGQSKDRVAACFDQHGVQKYSKSSASTLDELIAYARSMAVSGDSILFSPGFASFDMFKNFEERGRLYKSAVQGL